MGPRFLQLTLVFFTFFFFKLNPILAANSALVHCSGVLEIAGDMGAVLEEIGLIPKVPEPQGKEAVEKTSSLAVAARVAEYAIPRVSFFEKVNSPALDAVVYRWLSQAGYSSQYQMRNFLMMFLKWPLNKQNEWIEAITFWTLFEFRDSVSVAEGAKSLKISEKEYEDFRKALSGLKQSNYVELKLTYFVHFHITLREFATRVASRGPRTNFIRTGLAKLFPRLFQKKSIWTEVLTDPVDLRTGQRLFSESQIVQLGKFCQENKADEALTYLIFLRVHSLNTNEREILIGFLSSASAREKIRGLLPTRDQAFGMGELYRDMQAKAHIQQLQSQLTLILFFKNWLRSVDKVNSLKDLNTESLLSALKAYLISRLGVQPQGFFEKMLPDFGLGLFKGKTDGVVELARQIPFLGKYVSQGEDAVMGQLNALRELLARYLELMRKKIPDLNPLLVSFTEQEKAVRDELALWTSGQGN